MPRCHWWVHNIHFSYRTWPARRFADRSRQTHHRRHIQAPGHLTNWCRYAANILCVRVPKPQMESFCLGFEGYLQQLTCNKSRQEVHGPLWTPKRNVRGPKFVGEGPVWELAIRQMCGACFRRSWPMRALKRGWRAAAMWSISILPPNYQMVPYSNRHYSIQFNQLFSWTLCVSFFRLPNIHVGFLNHVREHVWSHLTSSYLQTHPIICMASLHSTPHHQ